MRTLQLLGIMAVFFGICGCAYSVITYSNDTSALFGYNYQPPLTNHETMVQSVGIWGIVVLAVGICMIYMDATRKK